MSRFSMDTETAKSQVASIASIANQLRNSSTKVNDAAAVASEVMSGQTSANVYASLSAAAQKLLTEAAQMDNLGSALAHIAQAYERADASAVELVKTATLTSSGIPAITGDSADDAGGIAGFISAIVKWIKDTINWILNGSGGDPSGETHEPTIREQEKAHDLAMQEEVFSLLESDQFSKETWDKATLEQRKQILTALMPAIAGVYGIPTPGHLRFESLGSTTRGSYNRDQDTVRINVDYLSRSDSYAITQTMIHEMRHAYQYEVVDHPENFNVSEETVAAWRDNFQPGHYRRVGATAPDGHTYIYDDYVTQPVEWDAKNFARQMGDRSKYDPDYAGSWD